MANNYTQATVSPDLPATLFSSHELEALEADCGLSTEESDGMLYFFASDYFSESGDAQDGFGIECTSLFQEKLRQLDSADYPAIVIHGACSCSKMRPDEFAGFAFYITRDDVRSMSTREWLEQQMERDAASASTAPKPYSVLLLYPDYANDSGSETYYAFVEATHPLAAIVAAKRQAIAAQECIEIEPDDFVPLLVTAGHHRGAPLFDK
jgi:hypothetical protein